MGTRSIIKLRDVVLRIIMSIMLNRLKCGGKGKIMEN